MRLECVRSALGGTGVAPGVAAQPRRTPKPNHGRDARATFSHTFLVIEFANKLLDRTEPDAFLLEPEAFAKAVFE